MTRGRLILLPPSEGQAPGGDGPPLRGTSWVGDGPHDHPLGPLRCEVIAALRSVVADRDAARRLFGLKDEALDRAIAADLSLLDSPTMPAIERYTGVLYDHLDLHSLDRRSRRRLDSSVVVLSGLWGAVEPGDPLPDHRLKMGATLPGVGRLSTRWRDPLADHLATRARRSEVWNLLPAEHAAAWRAPDGVVQTTATFLERRGDALVAVSHWNKALKGALVAHLVRTPSATPEQLVDWEHPAGYLLDPESLAVVDGYRRLRFVVT